MEHSHFYTHGPLRRTLLALILIGSAYGGAAQAAETTAWDGWHHRHHDNVTISGAPATTVSAGNAYAFAPSATDSEGRTLAFAIANKPSWASFSPMTGQLSGTPAASNVGTYANIVVAVSDGIRNATLPPFTVQVTGAAGTAPPPPTAPTISGTPATTDVAGAAYSFQPKASGPSGTTLGFSVLNKPSWATFSVASGLLSGTPTQAGTSANIIISVSDGQSSSALPGFSITVTAATAATGNAVVNWVPRTQNTNGSPLTDLAGIKIYYGTSSSNLSQMVQVAGTGATATTIPNLASGVWYFGGVSYTSGGTQSAMSSVVSATIP